MWTARTLCGALIVLTCWLQLQQGAAGEADGGEAVAHQAAIDAVFTPTFPETIPPGLRGEQIRMGYEVVDQRPTSPRSSQQGIGLAQRRKTR